MAKVNDKNYVSVWFWIFSMVVLSIPLVNIIMVFVWAFAGENESRKNYFKAFLWVFLFWIIVFLLLLLLAGFIMPKIPFSIHLTRGG